MSEEFRYKVHIIYQDDSCLSVCLSVCRRQLSEEAVFHQDISPYLSVYHLSVYPFLSVYPHLSVASDPYPRPVPSLFSLWFPDLRYSVHHKKSEDE